MKTKLMILALALMSMGLQAQTAFKAQLKEGDVFNYTVDATMKMAAPQAGMNLKDLHFTMEQRFTVKTAGADSAVIESVVTQMDAPGEVSGVAPDGSPFSESLGSTKALVGKPVLVSVNPDGSMRHILNLGDIKQQMTDYLSSLPKDGDEGIDAAAMAENICNDSTFLASYDQSGIFKFFGKTLKTGDTEDINVMGLKSKAAYTVSADGRKVEATYSPNMTSDDVKQMIVQQLKAAGQDEAIGQIDQMWPQMEAMGMAKVDISGTETQTFGDKGWPETIDSDLKANMMGMEMGLTGKAVLKK